MAFASKKALKLCLYVVLFCIPIVCLVCGIIIQKEGLVIGGTMGILLAFIISILFEFHERQVQRRQNSVRILVSSNNRMSDRNINIEIVASPAPTIVVETIPDDNNINMKGSSDSDTNSNCGAPKSNDTKIEIINENM